MRKTLVLSLALIIALLPSESWAATDFKAKLQALPDNAAIRVELRSKEKIEGLKGPVSAESFIVKTAAAGDHQDSEGAVREGKSIKRRGAEKKVRAQVWMR